MTSLNNVHADSDGYNQLANLYAENKDKVFDNVRININTWFDAHLAAPLGAILDLLAYEFNDIEFEFIQPGVKSILRKNGFLSHFGFDHQFDSYHTTIPYQKLKPDDSRFFREYVTTQLLDRNEMPNVSEGLKKKITEAILELFVNAQIHSKTEHIYTCGQFFPNRHTINFCIADSGIGFRKKFIERFDKPISSIEAIKWAIGDKHTTKIGIPGGYGLSILKEFILLNNGCMQIISDRGFYQLDQSGEKTVKLDSKFPGSIVNVLFRTDDTFNYSLSSEKGKKDLF